jgi:hypothetical protein
MKTAEIEQLIEHAIYSTFRKIPLLKKVEQKLFIIPLFLKVELGVLLYFF